MNKFAPLSPKVNALLHGADYNPEQWENYPDIIDKDIAMMQQAAWLPSSLTSTTPSANTTPTCWPTGTANR